MDIVYYYDEDFGFCPVKKYLNKFKLNNNNYEKYK